MAVLACRAGDLPFACAECQRLIVFRVLNAWRNRETPRLVAPNAVRYVETIPSRQARSQFPLCACAEPSASIEHAAAMASLRVTFIDIPTKDYTGSLRAISEGDICGRRRI